MKNNVTSQVVDRISSELSQMGVVASDQMRAWMTHWLSRIDSVRSAEDAKLLNQKIEAELALRQTKVTPLTSV